MIQNVALDLLFKSGYRVFLHEPLVSNQGAHDLRTLITYEYTLMDVRRGAERCGEVRNGGNIESMPNRTHESNIGSVGLHI